MFKRLIILLLEFGAGLAGNLAAGWVQQDAWQNLFTPPRLAATAGGAALMLLLLALLESERTLAWNWRWHRYWYLRALAHHPDLQRWQTDFARLTLANGRQAVVTAELLAAGQRQDMVAFLHAFLLSPAPGPRAVLVLGEPGAGKSTGLERLAWQMARQGAPLLGWGNPIPVLLRLGNYQEGSLLEFAAQQMHHAVGGRSAKILSRGFETLLEAGRIVLLCDALDEALGARRDLALAEIGHFLESQAYVAARLALTARTREDPGSRLRNLPVYTIQDLNDEAVRAFVRAYRRSQDDKAAIMQRLQKFRLLEPGGLGRNPFWLKLVVESGAFQGRKGQILQQAIETLLAREWDKPETQRAGWQRRPPPDRQLAETRRGLAWLAYRMSVVGQVAVELEEVENRLLPDWLAGRPNAAGLLPGDIVGLGRDAQLLVYGPGPLRFRHRLLQEALTAWALAEDSGVRRETIARYAGDTAWWETLLMLGHMVDRPEELALQILGDSDHDAHGEYQQDEQRLFLALGILGSLDRPSAVLRQRVVASLGRSLVHGVSDSHRVAARALAESAWDEAMGWLSSLLQEENEMLQLAAVGLAATIGGNAVETVLAGLRQEQKKSVGRHLAQIGDPRPGVGYVMPDGRRIPDIVWGEEVPAGTYTIGDDNSPYPDEKSRKITIAFPYRLSRYPVTYAQFQCFLDAPDFNDDRWWAGMPAMVKLYSDVYSLRELGKQAFPFANHPREGVSWYQAVAFCRWLSAQLGYTVELPHEYEWEVAARWPDSRFYPWGNYFDAQKANTREGYVNSTTAVGLYPAGRNAALELYDLSGNVWEWCRNKYGQPDDDRIDGSEARRVLRGGAWNDNSYLARATYRHDHAPAYRFNLGGFRLVCVRRPPSH